MNESGEVFIHYGYEPEEGEIDIPLAHDLTFNTKDGTVQYTRTMATGDYNGDGCDDIVVSAPAVNGSGTARGEVYVYFGRGPACVSSDPIDGAVPDVIFEGGADNDKLGDGEITVIGDVNGDGKIDFVFADDNRIYVAYGGDAGGQVTNYTITGLKLFPGLKVGYGHFNSVAYSDLVIGNHDSIKVYYGSDIGISGVPSQTIDDISPVNYSYPPSVTNFAMAVSPSMPDINGDGFSDLITASSRGLLIYYTINGELMDMPSVFDSFIGVTSTHYTKLLMLDYGIVYCDSTTDKGSCYILSYGE